MKNMLACLIVGTVMLVPGLSQLQAQSVLIDVLCASGNPGNTVQVPVVLESSGGTHPAGIQVDLGFNTSVLTYVKANRGPAAATAGKSVSANLTAAGNLRLLVAALNQTLIDDGVVAIVEFQIAGNAPVSSTPLTLSGTGAGTLTGGSMPSSAGSGLVIISGGIANPSYLYFSQVADGGGYSTSFVLVNPGSTSASALLELFKQDGTPLTFKLNGNLDTTFSVTLPGRGLALLESANSGDVRAGWARVRSSAPVGGSIVYSYAPTPGKVVSEAGIDPSNPTSALALSVDTRRGFLAGLALANPNAAAVSLELTLYNMSGERLGRQTRNLPSMNQFALLVDQLFPGINTGNFTGVVTVAATGGEVVGTTLRFTSDLSVFSSIPVINAGGGVGPAELYFPQVADGAGFSTMFVLLNPGNAAITATLELFGADGSAMQMTLSGTVGSTFTVSLPAKGLAILESPNAGSARAGWARVRASGPIGGSIVYGYSAASGILISEAGINPAAQVNSFALSVDTRRAFLSGLAVAFPASGSVSLTLTLYDSRGNQVSRQSRNLAGMRYFAEMVEQVFPGINMSNFTGIIVVTATGGRIVGTTLRFNADLSVFASIPVI